MFMSVFLQRSSPSDGTESPTQTLVNEEEILNLKDHLFPILSLSRVFGQLFGNLTKAILLSLWLLFYSNVIHWLGKYWCRLAIPWITVYADLQNSANVDLLSKVFVLPSTVYEKCELIQTHFKMSLSVLNFCQFRMCKIIHHHVFNLHLPNY